MKKDYFQLLLFFTGASFPFVTFAKTSSVVTGQIIKLATGAIPVELVTADFDHDGRPDFVVAQQGLNSVAVYRQAHTGGFSLPPVTYAVGLGPNAMVALDLNYTGTAADLVVTCGGDGTFYTLTNTNQPNGGLIVGATWYYYGPSYGPNPRLAVGYIDRDARPDLLFGLSTPAAGMVSWNYQSQGNWEYHAEAPTGGVPSGMLLGDLDGDSFPDLAASVQGLDEVTVFRNDGTNAPFPYFTALGSPVHVPTLGRGPVDVATADLNQDSRPDLLTANGGDNTVSLLLGTGAAKFGTAVLVRQPAAPRKLLAVDLDGDQRPELVTINADNTLNIYHNTGLSGPDRYGAPLTLATGANPVALHVADFNGDRRLDLAVACADDNTVHLYYNTTATALATRSVAATRLNLFPNPASTELRIQRPAGTTTTALLTVSLLDLTGRQVLTQEILGTVPLDVSRVPRGLYVARLASAQGVSMHKLELR